MNASTPVRTERGSVVSRSVGAGSARTSAPLGLLVAIVLMACGADTRSSGGAGGTGGGTAAPPGALESSTVRARLEEDARYRFERNEAGIARASNTAHQMDVALAAGAVAIAAKGEDPWRFGLRWTGLGRGAATTAVRAPASEARVAERRASYLREDGSEEWYESGPRGLEQGFVLPAPPAGARDEALAIDLAVEGSLSPAPEAGGASVALRDASGTTIAHYSDLAATDAGGAVLRAWMEVAGSVIRLRVDDAGARYPLTIDPMVWTLQQEITAFDGASNDDFGSSVAVSGAVAVIGAPSRAVGGRSRAGVVYVFVQSGTTWSLQQEITASDPAASDGFGSAVSVSGTTLVVGAPNHTVSGHSGAGAAYVFVQGGTTWAQQQEITASDAATGDGFGTSVGVSGGSAIVGAPNHTVSARSGCGAAYVFAQSGTTWSQQQELTASDGAAGDALGTSVAISGTNAVVGSPYHTVATKSEAGAAYVFVQSGSTWAPQQELAAGDAEAFDGFGMSVSVSGPTALIGAPSHAVSGHSQAGAAYVFAQSGTTWSQQQQLTASDAALADTFGFSVSVSGSLAIVGAYQHDVSSTVAAGAAYEFLQTCPSWAQQSELTASDKASSDFFGYSVAASSTTSIVGAFNHDVGTSTSAGAAYVYSGSGSITTCCIGGTVYSAGTVNPASSCQVCTPSTSTNTWSSIANGTACNDGNACTQTDTCQAGVCTGSNPVTCSVGSDQCHLAGTCDPTTGACSNPQAPNGTACNDGNACTQNDICQAGVCTSGNPVTCTASDQCHVAGTCNPLTGVCSNPQLPNGTSCNDGNACTQADTCQAGVCTSGNPVTCTASDQCHVAGTCNPLTGVCSNPQLPNGTSCNDGNACTQNDICQAGLCTGGNPVTCTASDQCHAAGTCNPLTGMCSNPALADGSSCNDGDACTQTDICQAGACTGTNGVVCTASDACHIAGTCDTTMGACSNPAAPDGTSCPGGTCMAGTCIAVSSSTSSSSSTSGSTTTSSSGTGGSTATSTTSSSGAGGSTATSTTSSGSSTSSSTSATTTSSSSTSGSTSASSTSSSSTGSTSATTTSSSSTGGSTTASSSSGTGGSTSATGSGGGTGGSATASSSGSDGSGGGLGGTVAAGGGCNCEMSGESPARAGWLLSAIPLLVLRRRRSRRVSATRG